MSKQLKFLFYSLVILVAALSASTSFYYSKSHKNPNAKPDNVKIQDVQSSADTKISESPVSESSTQVTKATSSKDEPSHPTDIYTIQSKDTLFSVAQDNGLNLQELSDANGISDSNKIQSGQLIVIPKGGQVDYTIDTEQVTIIQKQVDNGKSQWRLDPLQTAQADGPVIYALSVSDKYTLQNKDTATGTATVKAESENGNIIITLIQPNVKGDKGIWAIKTVKKL